MKLRTVVVAVCCVTGLAVGSVAMSTYMKAQAPLYLKPDQPVPPAQSPIPGEVREWGNMWHEWTGELWDHLDIKPTLRPRETEFKIWVAEAGDLEKITSTQVIAPTLSDALQKVRKDHKSPRTRFFVMEPP